MKVSSSLFSKEGVTTLDGTGKYNHEIPNRSNLEKKSNIKDVENDAQNDCHSDVPVYQFWTCLNE